MPEKMVFPAQGPTTRRFMDFTPVHSAALDRLVAALERAFTLPEPEILSRVLGESVDSSAHDILRNWICRVLVDLDEAQAAQRLPDIVQRLDNALNSRRED
ncbi:hypothetical protein HHS34_002100 [Acidithiobacillus montserratensis]|uniref:Uncharacterized protein n=1 Tax=Acidithiobacillus montserratensis TaxID=2729135 RepID=A0ACD5HJB1_9PROT|nr:hypothetical protein [Acidithiobacillus montserratensis]MBU2747116.1 hypothetical protein [Acidithiobacillus montserratensis]